jgi:hypothetical protein
MDLRVSYGSAPAAASTSDRTAPKFSFFLIQTTTEKSGSRCGPFIVAILPSRRPVRQLIPSRKKVIELAKGGERDPERICDYALVNLRFRPHI